MNSIVVLGSTGSIGVNTLKIAKRFGIEIEALVANNNTELLNKQIKEFAPKYVAIANAQKKDAVAFNSPYLGSEGIIELLHQSSSTTVVNALVGYSGVDPTLECMSLGKKVALANKESLVVAGKFLDMKMIHPIDSEHFGLWYLLGDKALSKLYITASGGALRDWSPKEIEKATVKEVLRHPNWSMGQKITVDSATMVNKLFETLEARWLFDTTNIDAYIEKKSIVHALVEFQDGSTTAHLADTDMALPISYALNQQHTQPILQPIDLLAMGSLSFEKIDTQKYPLWRSKEYLLSNTDMGIVLNAANDLLVARFLANEISFGTITQEVERALTKFDGLCVDEVTHIRVVHKQVQDFLLT
ncbi:MAG: 1-deoxy-D-xylulose-5-phosphate reductoisomerase [Campylobacterota bacterium]